MTTMKHAENQAWTAAQRQSLEFLGIDPELFLDWPAPQRTTQQTPDTSLPSETPTASAAITPESTPPATETVAPPSLYKLGPWALQFAEPMPVERFPWVNDLASYIGSKPVEISHVGAQLTHVDCSDYAKSSLTPEQKKALWAILKPALNKRT
ncbi:hypothetical protein [Aliidiomarina sanyensis]|uniref:hypothetical protein n=1 Tax=Aliidiomarina sanyensis TaxID=1249555 RepID=UPI001300417F|nr:hypothetical protein [Aliidiomarina sanyensis]